MGVCVCVCDDERKLHTRSPSLSLRVRNVIRKRTLHTEYIRIPAHRMEKKNRMSDEDTQKHTFTQDTARARGGNPVFAFPNFLSLLGTAAFCFNQPRQMHGKGKKRAPTICFKITFTRPLCGHGFAQEFSIRFYIFFFPFCMRAQEATGNGEEEDEKKRRKKENILETNTGRDTQHVSIRCRTAARAVWRVTFCGRFSCLLPIKTYTM